MNPLRSVGARLSLALLVLVAGALGVVYAFVVPTLESRLVDAKLSQLVRAAPSLVRQYDADPYTFDLASAAATTNARVVLYAVLSLSPSPTLAVIDDSGVQPHAVADDPLAVRTAVSGVESRGTVERADQRYAEVAQATSGGSVLLLSASLHDALADVHLVQRRLLLAGLLGLGFALLVGYGGAWAFARRLRRLEHAAERIAEGHFEEPVVDRGGDEVGHLAQTFESMRVQLARLDHARREFVANASHELRTPLFSLSGFLELLSDEQLDEATRREFVATMQDQVARLSKLATDLLDLSRLDAGQLTVEREPVDLREVVETLCDEFAAVSQRRGQPLEPAVQDDVVALADSERVLQIGRALVENAFRHAVDDAPIRLRVGAAEGFARLAVEDAGPGIPPEHAVHVFERFYRVDDGTQASGSGLGLAIARELAELMGGSLRLEQGVGSVFALLLPLARAEEFSRENAPLLSEQPTQAAAGRS